MPLPKRDGRVRRTLRPAKFVDPGSVVSVCVIIAAWNAQRTIARAIASALAQAEVSEVIVVDDASTDATAAVAAAADDGSGRLQLLRQTDNRGPAAARNRALDTAEAAFVTILDSDDYVLPGRFAHLLAVPGWDAIADNIAFVSEAFDQAGQLPPIEAFADAPQPLDLCRLLAGAVSRRGNYRGELGFLKPLIRRDWLDGHRLRYDESLRLSEDFMLYASMISRGAQFLTVRRCGYVAVVRTASLSGNHTPADLAALLRAVDAWGAATKLDSEERVLLARYRSQLSANFRHRRLLDDKRNQGLAHAVGRLMDEPKALPRVVGRVLADKYASIRTRPAPEPAIRYLMNGR